MCRILNNSTSNAGAVKLEFISCKNSKNKKSSTTASENTIIEQETSKILNNPWHFKIKSKGNYYKLIFEVCEKKELRTSLIQEIDVESILALSQ